MSLGTVLLIILILLLVGALPTWPYSRGWVYAPGGILAVQMSFISRDALIAAMHAWVLDKHKPLGDILVQHGELSPERQQLLDALVVEHLKANGGSAEKSLTEHRTRKEAAVTREIELRLAEAEGRVLSREDVVREWAARISAAKNSLRGIPKRALLAIPGFTQAMARRLLDLVDEALDELAGDGVPRRQRQRRRVARGR